MRTVPLLLALLLALPLLAEPPNDELAAGFGRAISTRLGVIEHGVGLTMPR